MPVLDVFTDLNMQQFALRLRDVRQQRHLTQTQVAFRADLNLGNYNDLERGKRPGLRATTLYRLCQVLGVSADWLLGLDELDIQRMPLA
jgi:transcriptional regulator with XRE-family HTH domain